MCMCIHYITAWSKLDHDYSFRLRLVFAPHCPDYFDLIAPSLYHHFEVSSHSPVFSTYLILNPTGENTLHNYFFVHAQVLNSIHCLSFLITTKLSPLYYHGPLILVLSESEWIDLLRVTPPFAFGLLQRDECISCLIKLSAW